MQVDLPAAAQLRQQNLYAYLASFRQKPGLLLVGEAPGWRGCRFSGIPFTSEAQLCSQELPFNGVRTSKRDLPYSEATATVFWKFMVPYQQRFIVWNCIPYHPHRAGLSLTNRCPTRAEIRDHAGLLAGLVERLEPRQVIAIGKSAQWALLQLGLKPRLVRHPAHGGAKEFERNIQSILLDN
ncbi:MAG: uracil-DNA glycosylase [Anaerolineales bacterium]|nr:uracil-DNA glycosylase [Anaerolineales bacterium]